MTLGDSSTSDIVVYTGIFNNYDILVDPKVVENNIEYVCLTDDPTLTSDIWNVKEVGLEYDPHLANRYVKTHPHEYFPKQNLSLYIDGNILISEPVGEIIRERLQNFNIALHKHPNRSGIKEEAEACIIQNKASEDAIQAQMRKYQNENFPDSNHLTENHVIYRRHNEPDVKSTMETWWNEILTETPRDQLSLMYAFWKEDVEFNMVSQPARESDVYRIFPHKPNDWRNRFWPYWVQIRRTRDDSRISNGLFYLGRTGYVLLDEGPHSLAIKSGKKLARHLDVR
ncbi:glycosyltransferase domain-containing protein [Natrinema sp. H-ect4]|uniref:glycosyltransferase domain-containing protein n=1 Tax=Natrinema sp. H-ect4 TaxID=3242699 RepID=UPI0035A8B9DB